MTEYEWEPRRVPRLAPNPFFANHRIRVRDVSAFVSLEHPRESIAWVLKQHRPTKERGNWIRRFR